MTIVFVVASLDKKYLLAYGINFIYIIDCLILIFHLIFQTALHLMSSTAYFQGITFDWQASVLKPYYDVNRNPAVMPK